MITASEIYCMLCAAYGQPQWWSDDPFVVMVQSILVQNTSWSSVEKVTDAIANKLTPGYVSEMNTEELEEWIRPCGFCKGKAATIRALTEWYGKYAYQLEKVKALELNEIRNELLAIAGIGAETADVISVYAFHKASFIIDAYTRRFMKRIGFIFSTDDEIRSYFESGLSSDYRLYGWYHRLILEHGIQRCKKVPLCRKCVFANICGYISNADLSARA